jgi:hypothetical protein
MARTRKIKETDEIKISDITEVENIPITPLTTIEKNETTIIDELQKDMVSYGVDPYAHSSVYQFDDAYSKGAYFFEQSNYGERKFDYKVLNNIATHPIVASIIQTRINQVAEFSVATDDEDLGFRIQLKEKHRAPTEAEKKKMFEIREFLLNCGSNPVDFELNFESFVRQVIRDSLVYDQCNFEIIRNKKGQVVAFAPVDAATIRRSKLSKEEMKQGRRNFDGIHYVQVVGQNNKIVAEYTTKDLCFGVRRRRTSINSFGYGFPELEELYQTLQNLFNAETYNAANFTNGISAAGLVAIKSKMNPKLFRAFRREFYQMLTGVNNAKRTPLIQLDPDQKEEIQSVNLGSTNSEMEYNEWIGYLIKTACAIYQIDPAEIGFVYGSEGQSSSIFGADPYARVLMGREKGLRPLIRSLESWINKYIINELDENYEIRFVGLDSIMMKDKISLERHKMNYLTINEIRAEHDLPPIPGHDVVKDLAMVLAQNAQSPTEIEEMQQNEADKQQSVKKYMWEDDEDLENDDDLIDWEMDQVLAKGMPSLEGFDENKALFEPPQAVRNTAQRALDAKEKYGDEVKGGLQVGWTRASQLASGEKISYKTIKRMYSFFSRHNGNQTVDPKNKDFKWADNGYTAWQIWSGDAGFAWAKRVIQYVENWKEKNKK